MSRRVQFGQAEIREYGRYLDDENKLHLSSNVVAESLRRAVSYEQEGVEERGNRRGHPRHVPVEDRAALVAAAGKEMLKNLHSPRSEDQQQQQQQQFSSTLPHPLQMQAEERGEEAGGGATAAAAASAAAARGGSGSPARVKEGARRQHVMAAAMEVDAAPPQPMFGWFVRSDGRIEYREAPGLPLQLSQPVVREKGRVVMVEDGRLFELQGE